MRLIVFPRINRLCRVALRFLETSTTRYECNKKEIRHKHCLVLTNPSYCYNIISYTYICIRTKYRMFKNKTKLRVHVMHTYYVNQNLIPLYIL